jgi:hypothetical protein
VNRKEARTKIQPNPWPAGEQQQTGTGTHAKKESEMAQPGLAGKKPGVPGEGASIYGAGKHFRDTAGGPSDLERNPGIGSSSGTFASGESGISETDETTGVTPKPR